MWFKVCPKCEGDLYLRRETYGKDLVCLQCGYIKHIPHTPPKQVKVAVRRQHQFAKKRWMAA
jgi:DNA-directed RNA polymerase subunit M/transcription elongation factor TFIIS